MLSDAMTEQIAAVGDKRYRGIRRRPAFGWSRHVAMTVAGGSMTVAMLAFPFAASTVTVQSRPDTVPQFILPDECSYLPCDNGSEHQWIEPEPEPVTIAVAAKPKPPTVRSKPVAVKPPTVRSKPVAVVKPPTVRSKPVPVPPPIVEPPPAPVEESPPVVQPELPVVEETEDCPQENEPEESNGRVEPEEESPEAGDEYASERDAAQPVAEGEGTEAAAAG